MIPQDRVAYALAAWKRFDESVPDGLLQAVAGAFVLVAAADGELSHAEADRFFATLRSSADVFASIDFESLALTYEDLCEAMVSDPDDGKDLALKCIARVRGIPEHAELVKGAAEIVAAADGRVQSVEETVMREIRATLGMP